MWNDALGRDGLSCDRRGARACRHDIDIPDTHQRQSRTAIGDALEAVRAAARHSRHRGRAYRRSVHRACATRHPSRKCDARLRRRRRRLLRATSDVPVLVTVAPDIVSPGAHLRAHPRRRARVRRPFRRGRSRRFAPHAPPASQGSRICSTRCRRSPRASPAMIGAALARCQRVCRHHRGLASRARAVGRRSPTRRWGRRKLFLVSDAMATAASDLDEFHALRRADPT